MTKAFLIGAGATNAEYGNAPLSNNFLKILRDKQDPLFDSIYEVVKDRVEGQDGLVKENIEDLMIMANEPGFPETYKTQFIASLHRAIYKLLTSETKSTEPFTKEYVTNTELKNPTLFYKMMRNSRLDERDFFITLNYDLYLDREVLLRQRKIDYGIKKEFVNWLYDISGVPF